MGFILSVIGVVLILEGLPYFAFPGKVKDWALMLQEIPERGMRIIGLIAMATGLFILYMVRSL
jgi:uncharacterized protein YjeT (DUF2065 family)